MSEGELARIRGDVQVLLDRLDAVSSLGILTYPSGEAPPFNLAALYLEAVSCRQTVLAEIAECGWIILLDLYVHHGRKPVNVSSACIASMHAPTTALRWIHWLADQGLIERRGDPADRRRSYLELTSAGLDAVERWAVLLYKRLRKSVPLHYGGEEHSRATLRPSSHRSM